MDFSINLIATVGFWCGSFFYLICYPLSIFTFFNAQTLDYLVDNQAFVGLAPLSKKPNYCTESIFAIPKLVYKPVVTCAKCSLYF
jgi:hypothetical protein